MKIFVGSLTHFDQEVDAYVPTTEQGLILLRALGREFMDDQVIMRARMQRYNNYEEKFIGQPNTNHHEFRFSPEFKDFLERVEGMGVAESNLIKGAMK